MILSPIFQNITENDWNEMQQCSLLRETSYEKNSVIFHTGQMTEEIGLVIKGCIHIENIDLPGNKRLADYLNADRSALSKELSKMQAEGIVTFRKNHFTLQDSNYVESF